MNGWYPNGYFVAGWWAEWWPAYTGLYCAEFITLQSLIFMLESNESLIYVLATVGSGITRAITENSPVSEV